jgi:hypothetical protein
MSKYKHILKENYKLADELLDQAILVAPQIAQQTRRPNYNLDDYYYKQFLADYNPHAEQYVSNADTNFRRPSAQPHQAAATTSTEKRLFEVKEANDDSKV